MLVDAGTDFGIEVQLDTSDRTRPREMRGGASPAEVIELVVRFVAEQGGQQLIERIIRATVDWVLRHRRADSDEPVIVRVYGPMPGDRKGRGR
jgi:hypothetical protein